MKNAWRYAPAVLFILAVGDGWQHHWDLAVLDVFVGAFGILFLHRLVRLWKDELPDDQHTEGL